MAERKYDPRTGAWYERGGDGVIRRVGNAVPQMPANPAFPYEGPQAGANLNKTGVDIKRTVTQTQGDVLDNQGKARTLRQNPLSENDQALINKMREGAGDLPGVLRDITAAQGAVDRFQPFPGKGLAYGAGTPNDDDGIITGPLKAAVGGILPDQSQEDYQTLLGLQNQAVLNAQIAQNGPQTESDAVRMKLTGVSPNKSVMPNARLLAENQFDVQMKMERPSFYSYWANKLGSTQALNSKGQTADQVWNEQYQRGLRQMRGDDRYQTGRTPPKAPPRKQNRVIDWNDY